MSPEGEIDVREPVQCNAAQILDNILILIYIITMEDAQPRSFTHSDRKKQAQILSLKIDQGMDIAPDLKILRDQGATRIDFFKIFGFAAKQVAKSEKSELMKALLEPFAKDTDSAKFFAIGATSLAEAGHSELANQLINRSLQTSQEKETAVRAQINALFLLKRDEEAMDRIRLILREKKHADKDCAGFAGICAQQGHVELANRIWDEILKANMGNLEIYLWYTKYLVRYGETGLLVRAWNEILDLSPKPALLDACASHAGLVAERGYLDDAIMLWQKILSINNKYCSHFSRFVYQLMQRNQVQIAVDLMREIIAIDPRNKSAFISLAKKLAETDVKSSLKITDQLTSLLPEDPGVRLAHAHRLRKACNMDEAVRIWLPLNANYAKACATFAIVLEKDGQEKQAQILWREIAQVNPVACLAHGYSYLKEKANVRLVIQALEPLFPKAGEQKSITPNQWKALNILAIAAGRNPEILEYFEVILNSLNSEGLLNPVQMETLTRMLNTTLDQFKDDQVEEYVDRTFPARSRAWRVLEEQQPHIQFANTQSRRALTNSPPPRINYDPSPRKSKK